jgi:hypothetical protein
MSNRGPVAFTVGSNYTELTIAYFDAGWPTIYCSIDESQQLGRNRFSPKKLLLCPASVAVLRCIALLVLQSPCSPQSSGDLDRGTLALGGGESAINREGARLEEVANTSRSACCS